jgi:hypothetical protein
MWQAELRVSDFWWVQNNSAFSFHRYYDSTFSGLASCCWIIILFWKINNFGTKKIIWIFNKTLFKFLNIW